MRRRLVLASVVVAVVTMLFTAPASAAPGPGAPGIGDPYYPLDGNGGYDVSHYDIRMRYEPSTDRVSGTTTILARTTQELSRFNLDFLLRVTSVRVNNAPARFVSMSGGELVVTPSRALGSGSDVTIVVSYNDVPSNPAYTRYGAQLWTRTPTGVLASNAPQVAPWWFPSNDHLTDKATFDISVAVPQGLEVLSNGVLMGHDQQIDGWVRWYWRSSSPQNTYVTLLAIGQFDDLLESAAPSGMPFIRAYANNLGPNAASARASVERTPEVVEFLQTQFGPYPFEAQGGIVVGTGELGFTALENQTRPVYDGRAFGFGANTYVVAHELAHQWYADSVSAQSWRDVWLHEGFATYAQYLWSQYLGEGTAAENAQFTYDVIAADDPFWQVLPGDPGRDTNFHPAVYHRGALTLQALRTAVGDEAFFRILRTWAADHRYGNGSTEQFITLAEHITHQQLDSLFTTWLYTTGKPATGPNGTNPSHRTEPKSHHMIKRTIDLLTTNGHRQAT